MQRGRMIRALVGPNIRTIRWLPLSLIAPLGAWIVQAGARDSGNPDAVALPVAVALLGVWLCLVFEDPAEEVTSSAPVSLPLRRAIRAAIAIPPTLAVWFVYSWIGPLSGPTAATVTWLAAVVVLSLAAAATATRIVPSERSGMVAATGMATLLFGLPIGLAVIGDRPPTIDPSNVPVGEPIVYWSALIASAIAIGLVAHRDPAHRWGIRKHRHPTAGPDHRPRAPIRPVVETPAGRRRARA
ncbi:MAG: hypothetical protein WD739_10735 [Actinomycetota bacterium]